MCILASTTMAYHAAKNNIRPPQRTFPINTCSHMTAYHVLNRQPPYVSTMHMRKDHSDTRPDTVPIAIRLPHVCKIYCNAYIDLKPSSSLRPAMLNRSHSGLALLVACDAQIGHAQLFGGARTQETNRLRVNLNTIRY